MGLMSSKKAGGGTSGGHHHGHSSSGGAHAQHSSHSHSHLNNDAAKYGTPNGLYATCAWDLKAVRKLILDKKLAPFFPPHEERVSHDLDECPICFMFYVGGLNRTKCCHKDICTECFLQIKKPGTSLAESMCPFCNRPRFTVVFLGPKTPEERAREETEEQKVLDLQQKMREDEIQQDLERETKKQKLKEKESDNNVPSGTVGNELGDRMPSSPEPRGTSGSSAAIPAAIPPFKASPPRSSSSPEQENLEELMLMEAIRLSLMENRSMGVNRSAPDVKEAQSSPSPEDSDEEKQGDREWDHTADDLEIEIELPGRRRDKDRGEESEQDEIEDARGSGKQKA